MGGFVYLMLGIVTEVVGTAALKASHGFSQLWPSLMVVLGYGLSFYFLGLSLKTIPLGIGYAVWSGVGTAFTVIIGVIVWHETMSVANILGIVCIIAGVILLNVNLVKA
ncbi:multidrug efflux SMR transporter [Lentibacillus halophilus]|uniref:Multidrug efflux SMR transporter n=1 Tax=Lentibacillus halophilus TaxID=295065 RepID=A0ABP3J2G7_9BACI